MKTEADEMVSGRGIECPAEVMVEVAEQIEVAPATAVAQIRGWRQMPYRDHQITAIERAGTSAMPTNVSSWLVRMLHKGEAEICGAFKGTGRRPENALGVGTNRTTGKQIQETDMSKAMTKNEAADVVRKTQEKAHAVGVSETEMIIFAGALERLFEGIPANQTDAMMNGIQMYMSWRNASPEWAIHLCETGSRQQAI